MHPILSPNPETNFGLAPGPRTRRSPGSFPKYIYILLLSNGGYYVGSTRRLEARLTRHFQRGGSLATRQSRPISIHAIYECPDEHRLDNPRVFHLEVYIASLYADHFGARWVRGGLYGSDWRHPVRHDRNSWIAGTRDYFATETGRASWQQVRALDLTPYRCYEHLPSRLRINRRTGREFHSPVAVVPADTAAEPTPKWSIPHRPLPPGSLRYPTPTPSKPSRNYRRAC